MRDGKREGEDERGELDGITREGGMESGEKEVKQLEESICQNYLTM